VRRTDQPPGLDEQFALCRVVCHEHLDGSTPGADPGELLQVGGGPTVVVRLDEQQGPRPVGQAEVTEARHDVQCGSVH
jgi:hypothetical protein